MVSEADLLFRMMSNIGFSYDEEYGLWHIKDTYRIDRRAAERIYNFVIDLIGEHEELKLEDGFSNYNNTVAIRNKLRQEQRDKAWG